MNEYMLILRNTVSPTGYTSEAMTPEDHQKWGMWIGGIAQKGALVRTEPLEFEGITVTKSGADHKLYTENSVAQTGFLICKADSYEAAHQLVAGCPILDLEGGFVEVRQIRPFAA